MAHSFGGIILAHVRALPENVDVELNKDTVPQSSASDERRR